MKKTFPAFLAALIITVFIGGGMFMIGKNALNNAMTTVVAAAAPVDLSTASITQVEQALVQYQTREAQYQAQLNQAIDQINAANQQISTANQQIQQYQNVLTQLQNSGLITIDSNGNITINQPAFPQRGEHNERGD